jgi:flagellar biosynthetic protein FliR
MYELMVDFMINYFVIAFRIVLPVFAAILLVNTILAILAKVASQLNMFVIGMQLKLFVGLAVMLLIIGMVPSVADFIYKNMMIMLKGAIQWMT